MAREKFELRRTTDPTVFTIHLKPTGEQLGELRTHEAQPQVLAVEGPHKDDLLELADELYKAVQEAAPFAALISPFSP